MSAAWNARPGARRGVYRTALALLASLALFALALGVYGIRYATNDDAILANIASGAYGPDRVHLIYVNILFGCLIRPLYLLAEGVNWYVIVQLALVFVCCTVLCRMAMDRLGAAAGLCLFGAVAAPFLIQMLYMFQYVKNAALCVATGLLLVAATLGRPGRRTVLGVALVNVQKNYDFLQSVVYGVTGGLGFTLAIVLFASIRERLEDADCPKSFEGFPLALISAGLLALAFMGFSGLHF